MAFNRKIVYNDLIGIALSCIVSLLFVHGVCQFLGSTSKKQNDTATQQSEPEEKKQSDQSFNLAETNQRLVSSFILPSRNFKLVSQFIQAFTASIKDIPWLISQDYKYTVALLWNPSRPIAHCKLLI